MKGCLTSADACEAAATGIRKRWPEADVVCLPVSDGGEGWIDACAAALRATLSSPASRLDKAGIQTIHVVVSDPLLRPVQAQYLKAGELAVIEVAEACGLHLLKPAERNPLRASSRGVGELIAHAVQQGCHCFIIGLGGTAVSDAGQEMMAALHALTPSLYGQVQGASFTIASDVTNPLYGPDGAAAVFGPQKGATPAMVQLLDQQARAFAETNARLMGFDRSSQAGAGAAGGLGYAFMQFFRAQCRSGADLLLELIHFDHLISQADFIITGEGRADRQTLMGKLPAVILRHARQAGVPCHLIAGGIEDEAEFLKAGFATVRSINPPDSLLSEAMRPEIARQNIQRTACSIVDESTSE